MTSHGNLDHGQDYRQNGTLGAAYLCRRPVSHIDRLTYIIRGENQGEIPTPARNEASKARVDQRAHNTVPFATL
jgi:hypothetical protein